MTSLECSKAVKLVVSSWTVATTKSKKIAKPWLKIMHTHSTSERVTMCKNVEFNINFLLNPKWSQNGCPISKISYPFFVIHQGLSPKFEKMHKFHSLYSGLWQGQINNFWRKPWYFCVATDHSAQTVCKNTITFRDNFSASEWVEFNFPLNTLISHFGDGSCHGKFWETLWWITKKG